MLPQDTFRDKTVLITGGGTGLGLETARQFGRLGANLVIASRSPEHLDPARVELEEQGYPVLSVETDVRRPRSARRVWMRKHTDAQYHHRRQDLPVRR